MKSVPNKRPYEPGLTYKRTKKLLQKYKHSKPMQQWRKEQYMDYVDIISTNIGMSRSQRREVKKYIRDCNFKKFYTRVPYECIVLALCYYTMWEDNPTREDISLESELSVSHGLTERVYNGIARNVVNYDYGV
jgi:hypothetical protein